MKKKFLLFSLSAVTLGTILMSDSNGPSNIYNGVKGNPSNCSSCHGPASAATTATIRVDSTGGVAVTKYVAGMTYTVTVTGSHTSNTKFGFQFAAVSGTGSAQVKAGTFGATLPSQVKKLTMSTVDFIEHSATITGPLSKSFTWTAPATNVGDVKMYLTVNAVDGNGGNNSADISNNTITTLTFYAPPTSVNTVAENATISAFPNPVMDELHLQLNETFATSTVSVFDITGRNIMNTVVAPNAAGSTTLNTSSWVPGMYKIVVANTNGSNTISVIKQ